MKKNGPKEYVLIIRFSGETNGKLERFYGVYEQKRHQFKSVDEYVHWHNEIKPQLSLNVESLETSIQAFHKKKTRKEERTRTPQPIVKSLQGLKV